MQLLTITNGTLTSMVFCMLTEMYHTNQQVRNLPIFSLVWTVKHLLKQHTFHLTHYSLQTLKTIKMKLHQFYLQPELMQLKVYSKHNNGTKSSMTVNSTLIRIKKENGYLSDFKLMKPEKTESYPNHSIGHSMSPLFVTLTLLLLMLTFPKTSKSQSIKPK